MGDCELRWALARLCFESERCRHPEPAGIAFQADLIRDKLNYGLDSEEIAEFWRYQLTSLPRDDGANSDDDGTDALDPADDAYLLYVNSLEPKHWKEQDHYRVLGLSRLRYKATPAQIKASFRQKVLLFHPDKKHNDAVGMSGADDDTFTCITHAYEVLSIPSKRRAYDSVDSAFDDSVPSTSVPGEDFYAVFSEAFERNARWSNIQPVPELGNEQSSMAEVNAFYRFWYDFSSWREFSYLDEEDKEKGENRDERRWIEKQNRAAREKRRKEELKRIRTLVDNAYRCDPRVKKFRDQERQRKAKEKQKREDARERKLKEERRAEEEGRERVRLEKEREEQTLREKMMQEKKEREYRKKALQKERKTFQDLLKANDYFVAEAADRLEVMNDSDRLLHLLTQEEMKELNDQLKETPVQAAYGVFQQWVSKLSDRLNQEREEVLTASKKSDSKNSDRESRVVWNLEETSLLVKAMTLFPPGTKARWDTVAVFINEHKSEKSPRKSGKDVAFKVRQLSKLDEGAKESSAKPMNLSSSRLQVSAPPSVRYTGSDENNAPWTAEEQKSLEKALKTFPIGTVNRWDRIAESIPDRTKKDCIRRYKEIAEIVRARKNASS